MVPGTIHGLKVSEQRTYQQSGARVSVALFSHGNRSESVTIRPQNLSQAQNPKTPTPKPQTPTAN